jgi:hypothetical protein
MENEAVQNVSDKAELPAYMTMDMLHQAVAMMSEGKPEQAAEFISGKMRDALPDGHPSKGFTGVIQGAAASDYAQFEAIINRLHETTKLWTIMLSLKSPEGAAKLNNAVTVFFASVRPDLMPEFNAYMSEFEAKQAAGIIEQAP